MEGETLTKSEWTAIGRLADAGNGNGKIGVTGGTPHQTFWCGINVKCIALVEIFHFAQDVNFHTFSIEQLSVMNGSVFCFYGLML